jgi:phosphocarrier protein
MTERTVVVGSPEGLHARPAALLVKLASQFAGDVELEAAGRTASAKSILGVLKLGVRHGDSLTIRVHGQDEERALDELVTLVSSAP